MRKIEAPNGDAANQLQAVAVVKDAMEILKLQGRNSHVEFENKDGVFSMVVFTSTESIEVDGSVSSNLLKACTVKPKAENKTKGK
jgi:hypothetical protein